MLSKGHFLEGDQWPTCPLYPPKGSIPEKCLEALGYFRPSQTRVIIVGQDPYPNPLNATGLAFSVPKDRPIPASLRNIYKEMLNDGVIEELPTHGDLTHWAKQGVLLLNRVLSVRPGHPGSDRGIGWEKFTLDCINKAVDMSPYCVVVLWGRDAQDVAVSSKFNGLILEGGHPSPLNTLGNFAGGRYFSRANAWLEEVGIEPIDWRV